MATLGEFAISLADRSGKRTPFRTPITAVASDGSNFTALNTLAANLTTAVLAMTYAVAAESSIGNVITGPYTLPTASDAVRSSKLAIVCQDSVTGKKFTRTLIAPLTTLTMIPLSSNLNLAVAPTDAFVTAYQAAALSDDGNALTILEIRRTGRALR